MTIDRAADSAAMFITGDLTEAVKFRAAPNDTPREGLIVRVRREGVDLKGGDDSAQPYPGKRSPRMLINLRNHSTLGVVPTEIINDTSQIYVPYPVGAMTESQGLRWYTILRIVKNTPGVVQVEVQT